MYKHMLSLGLSFTLVYYLDPLSIKNKDHLHIYLLDVLLNFFFFWCVYLDAASAEQQRPTSMKQDDNHDDDDVAMDTEEEKEMQAVDAPELKPEKLDSSKASRRGRFCSN